MGTIAIVGLEPDAEGMPDVRAVARLRDADTVVVPSATGAPAAALGSLGIPAVSLAELGLTERASTTDVVEALLRCAATGDVAFVAGAYPLVREGLISAVLARGRGSVDVFPVASPLQVLVLALDVDMTADLEIVDAGAVSGLDLRRDTHLIITGVDNALEARSAASYLRGFYAAEHTVVVASGLEGGGFELTRTTLDEIASLSGVPRGSALYVSPSRIEAPGGFQELVRIIAVLRGPDGCPWDREQTHASLAPHMIEEAYEAVAAIEAADPDALADELGDVLLQVVLNAQIGADDGSFTIDDVIASIVTKIRRRHPHVFGEVNVETAEEVTRNWDAIKRGEKPARGVLGEVPASFPSLMRAQKISRRAAAAGFEWDDIDGVWAKVHEEIDELKATQAGSAEAEEELGDLLFTVVNVARKMGVDAETALRRTCEKFTARFEDMERASSEAGRPLDGLTADEWDGLWEGAKRAERTGEGSGQ
ncbi:MAG TPA: nucleoside triphosphate pyrophosphohydrolase [Coriobacteriia bacterium]|nr:MAG: MazG family protein [Actinobacteria bacterium 66_15]HAL30522.1 nucleoside triphosphate pyrophosphohydrolase [Coriobacteriia bacterium]